MADAPQTMLTEEQIRALAAHLPPHAFPQLGSALRGASDAILKRWRQQTLQSLPHLDRLTIDEFENSIADILNAIAGAMEAEDTMAVRVLLEEAPEHGFDRFLQKYDVHDLFTEERILRRVVVVEIDAAMGRPATKDEATALHELLDVMSEFALMALYCKRAAEAREAVERASRSERLASLGTLALGIGHDLRNLLFPLRARLSMLQKTNLPTEAHEHLDAMDRITNGMRDPSVNLRYLAVDPDHREHQDETVDLASWCPEFQKFIERVVEGRFNMICDVPDEMPPAAISRAALWQAIFNLIHNAANALRDQPNGRIVLTARARCDGGVRLIVADNGPGMPLEVRQRCFEPFYTTQVRSTTVGTGIGLALVHALLTTAGAHIEVHSPLPPPPVVPPEIARELANGTEQGDQRGTVFIIDLPPHRPAA